MCTMKENPLELSSGLANQLWRAGADGAADLVLHDDRLDSDRAGVVFVFVNISLLMPNYAELRGQYAVFVTNEDGTPQAEALTAEAYNKWHKAEFGS